MTALLAAVLFGAAASVLVGGFAGPGFRLPRRALSDARRATLLEAVGLVHGSEEALRRVARRQRASAASAAVIMVAVVAARPNIMNSLAAVAVVGASWQVPLVAARTAEKKRRRSTDTELTDTLGEMVMGVEAGLTLEAVMNLYAQRHRSPLADEFRHMLERINLGTSRSVALQELRERTPTMEMQMFVSALQQNQKLGTPLAEVLRQQGASSRRRRRQAVEEAAATLSLKMIFPTVFCVLPVLLIVIVGPAVVRLVHSLPG